MKDRFDTLLLVLLIVCSAGGAVLLTNADSQTGPRDLTVDKALEQEMAYRAKVSFLERLYAPVTKLHQTGQNEAALLKLDELSRSYPDEAHGEVLRGETLLQLGEIQAAIKHLARAVRMNGDYVDQNSPLSRRILITELIEKRLTELQQRAVASPATTSLQQALSDLHYLQGRLAGGCE